MDYVTSGGLLPYEWGLWRGLNICFIAQTGGSSQARIGILFGFAFEQWLLLLKMNSRTYCYEGFLCKEGAIFKLTNGWALLSFLALLKETWVALSWEFHGNRSKCI